MAHLFFRPARAAEPGSQRSQARLHANLGTFQGARAGDFELLQLQEDILIMYNIIYIYNIYIYIIYIYVYNISIYIYVYIYMYNILGKNIKQQSKVHVETSNPTRCRI